MPETVVCVGGLVLKDDRVLLVRQSPGHSLEGQWTIPWGEIDPGEPPSDAVLREISEEAGVTARVNGLLGLQELPDPWLGMIGILFLCDHVDGQPAPDSRETDAAEYFSLGQLDGLPGPVEPLSRWLVGRVLSGQHMAISSNSSGPYVPSRSFL